MGLFRYEAVDGSGKVVHGAMNAADEQQLAQALAQNGYALRAVHASPGGQPRSRPNPAAVSQPAAAHQVTGMRSVAVASGVPVSIKSRVPPHQLAVFFRQLATLVRSGIPLFQSLVDTLAYTRSGRLQEVVPLVQQNLQSGQSLSTAVSAFPGIFPAHAVASVWSGELSGKLEIVLDEVATDFEREASETRYGRIGWGLTKISVIALILSLPLFNLRAILAPVLEEVPTGAGTGFLSTWLFNYKQMLISKLLPIVVALLICFVVWGHIKRVPAVRRILDGMLLATPIWGKVHRYRSIARFLHLMDELYAAGVNPSTAWSAASIAPRNSAIAEKLRVVHDRLPSAGLAELAASSNVFDPEDLALIATGEKTGQVPASFGKLADTYASRAAQQ
ncbi:MAG: hypothetical protein A2Z18_04010, partial [Armatimonadetes bacterium RBG_16_58_9]